jgi:hypothetical protein
MKSNPKNHKSLNPVAMSSAAIIISRFSIGRTTIAERFKNPKFQIARF